MTFNLDIYNYTDASLKDDCVLSGTFKTNLKLKEFLNLLPVEDDGIYINLINTTNEIINIRIKIFEDTPVNYVDIVNSNAELISKLSNNFTALSSFDRILAISRINWKNNNDKNLAYNFIEENFSDHLISITSSLIFYYFDEKVYDYNTFINLKSGFSESLIEDSKSFIRSLGYPFAFLEEFDFKEISAFLRDEHGANADEIRLTDVIELERREKELIFSTRKIDYHVVLDEYEQISYGREQVL